MVNNKLIFLIPFTLFTYCSIDSAYKAEVEWDIVVQNNNSFDITICIISDTSLEEWYRPKRLDTLSSNKVVLERNSASVFTVKYLHSPQDYDVEPSVEYPYQFKCIIIIDSLDKNILNAEIDLFPFPKWEACRLCDTYYIDPNNIKKRSYICYCNYQDTVNLFNDSAISTAEYFKIIN